MEFSVQERLFLLKVLPNKGDIITSKIINDFRTDLSFSEDELEDWDIKIENDGSVSWDKDRALIVDIDIGDRLKEMIIKYLTNFAIKLAQNQSVNAKKSISETEN